MGALYLYGLIITAVSSGFLLNSVAGGFLIFGIGLLLPVLLDYLDGN